MGLLTRRQRKAIKQAYDETERWTTNSLNFDMEGVCAGMTNISESQKKLINERIKKQLNWGNEFNVLAPLRAILDEDDQAKKAKGRRTP